MVTLTNFKISRAYATFLEKLSRKAEIAALPYPTADKMGGGATAPLPPPPGILAWKKSKEELRSIILFIILNPNDPLLETFIDYDVYTLLSSHIT